MDSVIPSDHIRFLTKAVEPSDGKMRAGELYERFSADPDLFCVPVVRGHQPIGLVNRHDFMLKLADQFGRALYEKRSIARVMDRSPLIVDANIALDDLGAMIVRHCPSALLTGFIVTEGERYLGVGTALSMLRMRVDQTHRRSQDMERARLRAEAANRAKTEFLANMSHELRTPLNAIIGFSEILERELFGPLGSDRYQLYVKDIYRSGTHLLALINEILDLSKIEAGKLDLDLAPANPAEIIDDTLRMIEPKAAEAEIKLVADVESPLCPIMADSQKLRQILLNLLSNAVKFSRAGSEVRVSARKVGDTLTIAVIDHGIGMTADEIEVALEPFGQIESGLDRRFEGTGLGLPLTKSLVELHGGAFDIQSRPGKGTQVHVRLPCPGPIGRQAVQTISSGKPTKDRAVI